MKLNNIVWHDHKVDKKSRLSLKKHQSCILWFTGLSGSGKSSIANAVEELLFELNVHTYLLDGDNIRYGLNKDLGFDDTSREENIRRIGEVAKLFVDAGVIALTAFISPFIKERDFVRNLVDENEFIEIYIDTPLNICEQRDPKGLYSKARSGEIKNFTGIDSPYEPPENPELHIKNDGISIEDAAKQVVQYLLDKNIIKESDG